MRNALELSLVVLLLLFLVWVPMPFGSASDDSQAAFVIPPLVICAAAALLASRRPVPLALPRAARLWLAGAVLFALVVALQLVPLPSWLLGAISPESATIWWRAARIATLGGARAPQFRPITVDPSETALQLFRILACAATFLAALLLVRTTKRRMAFATVLAGVATFEAIYGIRETALQHYEIWGWTNTLIFGRPSGTFVNPNHYAHYAAIVLPVALYLGAYAWHTAAAASAPLGYRVVQMVERRTLPFAWGLISGTACIAAVLISQSRGALVAIVGGFAIAGALATSGWRSAVHGVLVAIAVVAILVAAIFILGRTETMNRIEQSNATQLTSRRGSIAAALRIWERFPLTGSGAGTYQDLVLTTGATPSDVIANHAHNDYVETLATTGALGFVVSVVPLLGGYISLARAALRKREPASWRRRAFALAALTSIAIAMIHALIDFNFYIPANAATLAAIAGAAVIVKEP